MVDIRTERTRNEIEEDILEQIEEGQRDDAEIRDFEELAEELGI